MPMQVPDGAPGTPLTHPRPSTAGRRLLLRICAAMLGGPLGLLGYHALGANGEQVADVPGESPLDRAASVLGLGGGYALANLSIFERDLYYVEQRYVEPKRIDAEAMLQAALDRVEREQPTVLFTRQPKGDKLLVAVGPWSTTVNLGPVRTVRDVGGELRRVAVLLDEHLDPSIPRPEIEYAFINGALSTLDPHTILLPPEQAREMEIDNQGEFGGLGIELEARDGTLTIRQPIDGTPASKVGLQADDQIVRIEDESTVNMDMADAITRLRGPVGSTVRIVVKRKGRAELIPVTIVRDRIKLNPVVSAMLEGDIGYIQIKSFNSNVSVDLEAQLATLDRQSRGGLKGVVLDLRDNPGGFLNQAVEVADRFIAAGVLVATVEGATGRREEQAARSPGTSETFPLAVLVNGSSASASEIVAGAVRNLNRGVIIGERTYGKGSVQHLYENKDASSLKLTVARYLTPGDQSIQNIGIPPDILLEPSVLRAGEGPDDDPLMSLYWREWIDREADLDRHLADDALALPAPTMRLRYLREDPQKREDDGPPGRDWEVRFARDVLAAATAPDRVSTLRAAAGVVAQRGQLEARAIREAFEVMGVDWRAGENPEHPEVELALDLGPDGMLVAGVEESVTMTVVNRGDVPLHQLSLWTASENPWLDEREVYIGHLPPGASRSIRQRVRVHDGYGDAFGMVQLNLRDPENATLATATVPAAVAGAPLPSFAYTLQLVDDGSEGSQGDGDGAPDAGERVALVVTVENTGPGASADAWVRARNRAGRALDLRVGSGRIGARQHPNGEPCDEEGSDACRAQLAPGAVSRVVLLIELREPGPDGAWSVDLTVGDNQRFDHTAVSKAGFYEYFQLEESIQLQQGRRWTPARRAAPHIELSRAPGPRGADAFEVLSGVVRDDDGVRDLMVFVGDEKVHYRGGDGRMTTMPFTVDAAIAPGQNHVVVLARDETGLRSSWSRSVWREPGPIAAPTAH